MEKFIEIFKSKQVSENYIVGIFLAVTGGYFDAYTYISRGGVFANAQTGNIVLLGINFAKENYFEAMYYLIPIFAFAIGVIFSEIIKYKYKKSKKIHWRQLVVFVEIILLIGVAFIPCGNQDVIANIIISFVCAMQVKGFRKINGNAVSTTMCTGNLRSASELLFDAFKNKNFNSLRNSLQYFGIIIFFIIGAIVGTVLTKIFLEKAILFAVFVLLCILMAMFKSSKE